MYYNTKTYLRLQNLNHTAIDAYDVEGKFVRRLEPKLPKTSKNEDSHSTNQKWYSSLIQDFFAHFFDGVSEVMLIVPDTCYSIYNTLAHIGEGAQETTSDDI
ncbi:MAG: hypothetical protein H6909_02280 [Rickettsiaceae bacterium]|nr:hypothetical protein [Rickettsiaceae bacterium]